MFENQESVPIAQSGKARPQTQWGTNEATQDSAFSANFAYETEKVFLDELEGNVRLGFIRKVFSILAVQLAATFGAILLSTFNASVNKYLLDPNQSSWIVTLGLSMLVVSTFVLVCCNHLTRTHPHNMILLSVYTLSQAIVLSVVAVAYDLQAVSLAVGVTFTVVLVLMAFASQTQIDFTGMGLYLYVTLWVLMFFGFAAIFTRSEGVQLVYGILGTLLFSFYIIYDVQLILGGNHKVRFAVDEYVMASLMLYVDIIQIFMFILRLIGDSRNNN